MFNKPAIVVASGALLAACASTPNSERQAYTGVALGALAGAALGAVSGDFGLGLGAAVGAGAGATIGGIKGCREDGGCGAGATPKRQYYDEALGKYYYYDQATGRYYWEVARQNKIPTNSAAHRRDLSSKTGHCRRPEPR
jgi:hypothetical protein